MGVNKIKLIADPTDIDSSDQSFSEPAPYTERQDNSLAPNRVIKGRALSGTLQTDSTWQIWREDTVGSFFEKEYAEVSSVPNPDFIHQWSLRSTLFPAIAFQNDFSIQFKNAVNSCISVPHNASIDFANSGAFSGFVWIKVDPGAGSTQTILFKASAGSGNNGYRLSVVTVSSIGTIEFAHRGSGTGDRIRVRADSFSGDLFDGAWHLVGWTKGTGTAASTVNLYIDGVDQTLNVLNDTLSGSTNNTEQLNIACSFAGGTPRYGGNLDEVAIWNAKLTGSEVTEIYNSNVGVIDLSQGSGQISSTLVSWWRMGDGSFVSLPTIPDEAGSNNATAQSAVLGGDVESEVPP